MRTMMATLDRHNTDDPRAKELYEAQCIRIYRSTDRLFAGLLVTQWLLAVAAAMWVSPYAWEGVKSSIHPHVWLATLLGLLVIILPVVLAIARPGRVSTRHIIAIAQALMSALFIHLTGGRIETHFHVFCSLALLAMYRDWRVLISATIVVAADHFIRGIVWPQSVYGTPVVSPWRFAEHAGWVLVEDVFLILTCNQSLREMWNVAAQQSQLEETNRIATASNEQLRNEIVERQIAQRELEHAKEAAEAASRAKSEFLANMSHELRTPLNAIIGFSDVLGEQVFGPLNENQQQYMSDILESGQHLLVLVNDILDLAKIESGTMDFEPGTVVVPDLIKRAAHMFRERAVRQGIRLVCNIDPELEVITGDERRLKQLLFNLLSNAIKYTPEGGEIVIRARRQSKSAIISVADTGVGIARSELERIFDNFYQVDSTLTKSKQGTGLGLALVRKIADLHGGRVWAESEPDMGSEFFLELPQAFAGAAESMAPIGHKSESTML